MLIYVHIAIQIALIFRVLLRPRREPVSRLAWVAVILAVPVAGILGYLLFGETSIGRRKLVRMRRVTASLPEFANTPRLGAPEALPVVQEVHRPLFRVAESISGLPPTGGNQASLTANSNAGIDALVADIDAAERHVHILFYIWMPDDSGTRVSDAVRRAALRGVTCRVLVDDVGSRLLVKSPLWSDMAGDGVKLARTLKVGNPLFMLFNGRIDIRNHRKIVVIDNAITYCGSQNCADPEFRTKPKFAPWVDVLARFTGPVARQNQQVFAIDWMTSVDEDIHDILKEPLPALEPGFTAQVISTGPTSRPAAAAEMFQTVMYDARDSLFITTPYYVPTPSLQAAICAAAHRGVETTIIFPARNDDFAVGGAARSYYEELLEAGVNIFEYHAGLLHSKTLTIDGVITLIGSANMDRRSFELNFENNILLCDQTFTAEIRARQQSYLAQSRRVTPEEVGNWRWDRRLAHNTLAILGPLL